ncbi:hypothetical protein [Streptomyces sp. SM12]|uniref:hypothetical protein n=1 Tax=Streptomyces sp. SM12 TaxID=1071602 RepID=UPI000CD53411|nr:hypothetical protein [Streptomyces sp. SM12]
MAIPYEYVGPPPRVRILELPTQYAGDTAHTPCVVVVDRAGSIEDADNWQSLKDTPGVVRVWVFRDEVDL